MGSDFYCRDHGCQRIAEPGSPYCDRHGAERGFVLQNQNIPMGMGALGGGLSLQTEQTDRTFDKFMSQVRDLMEGKAKTKGYHDSAADGPNQLYAFVAHFCPSHTEGEIIYKAVRYLSKRDPADLLKIAAWAFLKWRWRDQTPQTENAQLQETKEHA